MVRKSNLVLVSTPHNSLFEGLEQALRPFGLKAVKECSQPMAGLVDFRDNLDQGMNLLCPVVGLVHNRLDQRKFALQKGCFMAVSEADSTALAAYLAEAVINLELEPERILLFSSCDPEAPKLGFMAEIGWKVHKVDHYQLGLEVMETFRPDLVILELWKGEESDTLCRVLRADPRWHKLVIASVVRNESDEARALEAGCDEVIGSLQGPGKMLQRLADRLQRFRPFRLQERDTLTGCLMRRHAASFLDRLIRLGIRKKKPLSLALVDLDHFKSLNDSYGHGAGDEVLARIGQVLRRSFRHEDVVARWGGEEFLIALYDSNKDCAARRFREIAQTIGELSFDFDPKVKLTFSAGMAELGCDGGDLITLIEASDAALYRAKSMGRNRVEMALSQYVEDVFLVEDDDDMADFVTHLVRRQGLTVRHFRTAEEALERLLRSAPKLCIIDHNLPGMSGMELARKLSAVSPTRVLMVTGDISLKELESAIHEMGFELLAKPFSAQELLHYTQKSLAP